VTSETGMFDWLLCECVEATIIHSGFYGLCGCPASCAAVISGVWAQVIRI
jgi:hypothetical protein